MSNSTEGISTQVKDEKKKKFHKKNAQPVADVPFQPGKFKPQYRIDQDMSLDEVGMFCPSFKMYDTAVEQYAETVAVIENASNVNDDDFDRFKDRVRRVGCFTLAKKLASSLDPESTVANAKAMKPIFQSKIWSVTGLISLADNYGYINDDTHGRYKINGQSAWAENYFMKAICFNEEEGALGRFGSFYVNLATRDALLNTRKAFTGIINGWAQSVGIVDLNFGQGLVMRGKPPILEDRGAQFHNFIMNLVVARDELVNSAYGICTAIDVIEAAGRIGAPNDVDRANLTALGVITLLWNTENKDLHLADYASNVQMRVANTINKVSNWVEVKQFIPNGRLGQLIVKVNETHFHSPIMQTAEDLEFGTLLAGEGYSYKSSIAVDVRSHENQKLRMVSYAQGMIKHGG